MDHSCNRQISSFRYDSDFLASRDMRYCQSDRCKSHFRYSTDFHHKRYDLPLAELAIDAL